MAHTNQTLVTAFNQTMSVEDWSKHSLCRVHKRLLRDRLTNGWPPEKAISSPLLCRRRGIKPRESTYRGVTYHRQNKRWTARIKHEDRSITIGYYDSEVAAALAYDRRARELRGDEAICNFASQRP